MQPPNSICSHFFNQALPEHTTLGPQSCTHCSKHSTALDLPHKTIRRQHLEPRNTMAMTRIHPWLCLDVSSGTGKQLNG